MAEADAARDRRNSYFNLSSPIKENESASSTWICFLPVPNTAELAVKIKDVNGQILRTPIPPTVP